MSKFFRNLSNSFIDHLVERMTKEASERENYDDEKYLQGFKAAIEYLKTLKEEGV